MKIWSVNCFVFLLLFIPRVALAYLYYTYKIHFLKWKNLICNVIILALSLSNEVCHPSISFGFSLRFYFCFILLSECCIPEAVGIEKGLLRERVRIRGAAVNSSGSEIHSHGRETIRDRTVTFWCNWKTQDHRKSDVSFLFKNKNVLRLVWIHVIFDDAFRFPKLLPRPGWTWIPSQREARAGPKLSKWDSSARFPL